MKGKPTTLVVRKGAIRRFDRLKTQAADVPVDVIWDRRKADAKSSAQSRAGSKDRRQKPPFTWETADFVVVETAARERTKKK